MPGRGRLRRSLAARNPSPYRAFKESRSHKAPLEFGNIVGRAIIRLIGAVLLEANDEWQTQSRYMQTEAMAELTPALADTVTTQISTQAA